MDETSPKTSSSDLDYAEALDLLYGRINYERLAAGAKPYRFKLTRIRVLLDELGLGKYLYPKPDDTSRPTRPPVPLIHLAGTKGKGSTATMVASCLSAAGYRTGLYTSPHLHLLEERFRVDLQPCSAGELCQLINRIAPVVESMSERSVGAPTFFEMTTAIAMLHFHVSQCDAIVIETGLGGRLDSTNVLWPTVSAITTIGMDHQNLLGDTLAAIAREKAGIIKQSVPVVCGVTESEPWEVIREIAAEKSAVMIRPGDDFAVECRPSKKWGVDIYYQSIDAAQPASRDVHPTAIRASLPIDGVHQGQNAGLAIAICETLRGGVSGDLAGNTIERPLTITDGAIRTGLAALPTVGRIERFELTDGTIGIVDTAHNEDSTDALCHCVRGRFAGHAISVVFGTSHDKDPAVMLPQLCEIADTLVLTQFSGNPRFKPAEELVETVPTDFGGDVLVEPNSALACELALQSAPQLSDSPTNSPAPKPRVIVCCGSFFLAAEVRPWIIDRLCPFGQPRSEQ